MNPRRTTIRMYLAGPMTGIPDFNYPAFHEAEKQLRAHGYHVVSPAVGDPPSGYTIDRPYGWYLRRAITMLLECDELACLPRWESSSGARLERQIAYAVGMPVSEWSQ